METSNFSRVRGVRGPDSPHENCHFQPENREFRPNLAKSCQILRNPGSRPSNSWKSGSNRPKSAQISLLDLKNRKIEKKNTLVRAWNRTFTLFQGRPPKLTKTGVKSGSKRGQIGVQTVKSGSKWPNSGKSGVQTPKNPKFGTFRPKNRGPVDLSEGKPWRGSGPSITPRV